MLPSNGQRPPALQVGQSFIPFKLFTGIFIPEALVRSNLVSPGAKMTYGRLARYSGQDGKCFPAVGTLGQEIGVGVRQAQKYLAELEQAKLIRRRRRFLEGAQTSNAIDFLWHPLFEEGVNDRSPGGVHDSSSGGVHDRSPKESQPEESPSEEIIDSADSATPRLVRHSGACDSVENRANQEQPTHPREGRAINYSNEERKWISDAIGSYGLRRTMREHMREEPPTVIVQKCLAAANGLSVQDIFAILRELCNRGFDPGARNGPRGWGWFPTIIENAVKSEREGRHH